MEDKLNHITYLLIGILVTTVIIIIRQGDLIKQTRYSYMPEGHAGFWKIDNRSHFGCKGITDTKNEEVGGLFIINNFQDCFYIPSQSNETN